MGLKSTHLGLFYPLFIFTRRRTGQGDLIGVKISSGNPSYEPFYLLPNFLSMFGKLNDFPYNHFKNVLPTAGHLVLVQVTFDVLVPTQKGPSN